MALGLLPLLGLALLLSPTNGPRPEPTLLVPILAAASIGLVLVGVVVAMSASGADPGRSRSGRILISLALRDAGGVLAILPVFLGAGRTLPAVLTGLAIVSILALLPPRPSRP